MKNKKMIKFLTVLLFGVLVATGCSCTNSMCTEQDLNNIKNQIELDGIDTWREEFSMVDGKSVYPEEFNTYYTAQGFEGVKTKSQVANEIEQANPNVDYTDASKTEYVATRTEDFQLYVSSKVEEIFAKHPKACLTVTGEKDPTTGATLEAKTWGDAWKTGLLEGLIVFPLAWLLSVITSGLGGQGGAQLAAIAIVTLVIRVFMLLIGFKGQVGNMKMQEIQPKIQELNARFNDPKISEDEKRIISQKMINLYKENGINPASSFLTTFIQFPIFIAVWAAMNQTVAIRSGVLFGLEFGVALNEQIFAGNITAILLMLIMIGGQLLTIKMPNIIRWFKDRKKPDYKKVKNSSQKQMNTMMIMMVVLIVLSAFVLPAALVIYWVLGSIFSIIQTLIFSTEFVNSKLKGLSNRKKKVKIVK